MQKVRVAVLGASGWMGKVHTMAYQTFPHFLGSENGTAEVKILVEANPNAAADLAARAPEARIIQDWKEAGDIVMRHIPGIINSSDDLTKPLGWALHERHARRSMGHFP